MAEPGLDIRTQAQIFNLVYSAVNIGGQSKTKEKPAMKKVQMPNCPVCGNNRQVWRNQLSGKLTCHRAFCHREITAGAE